MPDAPLSSAPCHFRLSLFFFPLNHLQCLNHASTSPYFFLHHSLYVPSLTSCPRPPRFSSLIQPFGIKRILRISSAQWPLEVAFNLKVWQGSCSLERFTLAFWGWRRFLTVNIIWRRRKRKDKKGFKLSKGIFSKTSYTFQYWGLSFINEWKTKLYYINKLKI